MFCVSQVENSSTESEVTEGSGDLLPLIQSLWAAAGPEAPQRGSQNWPKYFLTTKHTWLPSSTGLLETFSSSSCQPFPLIHSSSFCLKEAFIATASGIGDLKRQIQLQQGDELFPSVHITDLGTQIAVTVTSAKINEYSLWVSLSSI